MENSFESLTWLSRVKTSGNYLLCRGGVLRMLQKNVCGHQSRSREDTLELREFGAFSFFGVARTVHSGCWPVMVAPLCVSTSSHSRWQWTTRVHR